MAEDEDDIEEGDLAGEKPVPAPQANDTKLLDLEKARFMFRYNIGSVLNGITLGSNVAIPLYLLQTNPELFHVSLTPFVFLLAIKVLQTLRYFYHTARSRRAIMKLISPKQSEVKREHLAIPQESIVIIVAGVMANLLSTYQAGIQDKESLHYWIKATLALEAIAILTKVHFRKTLHESGINLTKAAFGTERKS